jgi:ribonucleoside-diphosphate reductase beta chain
MSNIFKERVNVKPLEYPQLLKFKDSIRHSYWIHTEYNITSDVQDFKVNVNDSEREAIKRTMLAISQIEVSVKTFWADIYKRMPKPEIGDVGMTFAESEVRHKDAYSFLLERLGLNEAFENIMEVPAIIDRVNYLKKHLSGARSRDDKKYALSVLLFSVFIEHVSLFSQFLIMMSFNKHKNLFKGISNIVEATSKEEDIHGEFGLAIVKIIRSEFPEWFDEDFSNEITKACVKAYKAEEKILDWIFEEGELDFMSKDSIKEFMKNRFNSSLESLKLKPIFEINEDLLDETEWFDDEMKSTKEGDHFVKRATTYTKKQKAVTEDDLF